MLGKLIPDGLLNRVQPKILNLVDSPLTVVFIHRWWAFVVLLAAVAIFWFIHKQKYSSDIMKGINLVVILVVFQIILGILVLHFRVEIVIALLHQANAIALFASMVFVLNRLYVTDRSLSIY
jgi:cytochrome c oxidase assembly protein subunit 15